jgi:uncharacterized protein with HEPN domain
MITLNEEARKFLIHIEDEFDNLENFTKNSSFEEYESNKMLQYAVHKSLENIGEACRHIHKKDDQDKVKFPGFDFKGLVGFKNKINHDYFSIDHEEVWETVVSDIPEIKRQFYLSFVDDLKLLDSTGLRNRSAHLSNCMDNAELVGKVSGSGIATSSDDISSILGNNSVDNNLNDDPQP